MPRVQEASVFKGPARPGHAQHMAPPLRSAAGTSLSMEVPPKCPRGPRSLIRLGEALLGDRGLEYVYLLSRFAISGLPKKEVYRFEV